MAEFRINYDKVVKQANQINNLSNDLGKEITKLENLLARIKNEWCGPASTEFQKQLIILLQDMRTTRKNMSGISSTIKNVANRIQKEDEQLAIKLSQGIML